MGELASLEYPSGRCPPLSCCCWPRPLPSTTRVTLFSIICSSLSFPSASASQTRLGSSISDLVTGRFPPPATLQSLPRSSALCLSLCFPYHSDLPPLRPLRITVPWPGPRCRKRYQRSHATLNRGIGWPCGHGGRITMLRRKRSWGREARGSSL